jgi:hypothetical protein
MVVYSLAFFEGLVFGGKCGKPPAEAVASLDVLATLVGSPTYSKTPNFKRQAFENKQWDNFRVFKKTEIVAQPTTVVEACTTAVRVLLNKLTAESFNDTRASILEALSKNELSDDDVAELCDVVCKIGSGSTYYAGMYARMTAGIVETVPAMQLAVATKLDGFSATLSEITHVDHTDYDAFCQMNAKKDARKGTGVFLIHLAKANVVSGDHVAMMVTTLLAMVDSHLGESDKKQHVEDLIGMIVLFLREGEGPLVNDDPSLKDGVRVLAGLKRKDHPGITSKAIFACMDYLESLA